MKITKLLLVMLSSMAVAACGGSGSGTIAANTGTGTGVKLSGTLFGFNSIANTSVSNGVYVSGGKTSTTGSTYVWNDVGGNSAVLTFSSTNGGAIHIDFNPAFSYSGTGCYLGTSGGGNPCNSVGIKFDRVTGVITFVSTPIDSYTSPSYTASPTPSGFTATGSLSFAPF